MSGPRLADYLGDDEPDLSNVTTSVICEKCGSPLSFTQQGRYVCPAVGARP